MVIWHLVFDVILICLKKVLIPMVVLAMSLQGWAYRTVTGCHGFNLRD